MNDLMHEALTRADTSTQAWPPHRVVAILPGSLPMGGVVPETPIHAFETPPPMLTLANRTLLRPRRRDIELGDLLAFLIDDVIDAAEADAIVTASERFGYRAEAPGISTPPGMRMNKSVHWMADDTLLGPMFERICHLLPPRISGAPLHDGFSQRINMYRYDAGDVFNRHTDGDWPGFGLSPDRRAMVQWRGFRSCLTMLLYLNGPEDGVRGGNTRLYRRDGSWTDVAPKKGSALFFRHGLRLDSVVHEGTRVTGTIPKYVARINVLYDGA
jgi:2OG-Fe(II) oxygenase superfamily